MDESPETTPATGDAPSGLPEEGPESTPLGVPEDADAPDEGEEAMPGIASEGEPPSSG